MRFFRRNQYLLLCLVVLFFSGVLVLWQFKANESAHTQRVENFLLAEENGDAKSGEQLYQRLIQELPGLSDQALVADLARTAMLIDPKAADTGSLVWKYHVSTRNELRKRAEQRLTRTREQAAGP